MAIFAAPYAALQADPLEDLGSSDAASIGSRDEETTDRAMALDESAGTLRFLARRGRDSAGSCFTYSTVGGGLGVRDWLFVGVVDDEDRFRKKHMVDARTTTCEPCQSHHASGPDIWVRS